MVREASSLTLKEAEHIWIVFDLMGGLFCIKIYSTELSIEIHVSLQSEFLHW
jgi:hypothetical protein